MLLVSDARSWSQAEQARIRQTAVAAVLDGMTYVAAAQLFSVSESTVNGWMRRHREGGDDALHSRRRGRRPKEQMALSDRQQDWLATTIRSKNPDQLRLPGFLWTREALGELIQRRYGILLGLTALGNYLRRWGFSPQKPVRRAFEQNPQLVQEWTEHIYPAIAAKAKREKALILWGDEMGLRSDHAVGRSWSPRGQTPVVQGTGQRFGANVISALSNRGQLYFMVFSGRANADLFISFLKRLVKQMEGRKIFLIVDGHPTHKAKKVRVFVADHDDALALYFLPPYSPELNPDELLNNDVKSNALGRQRPRTRDELIATTRSHLLRRQKQPQVVANFFNEKHVRYAAAS
ncbi:MAG: IS630 family transposase [Acidimicrobiales bacterium]